MKESGVIIDEGLENWQIIQQENGYGKIVCKGHFINPGNPQEIDPPPHWRVAGRILNEKNYEVITAWQEAELEGDNFTLVIDRIPAGGLYRLDTRLTDLENINEIVWGPRGDIVHHWGVGDLFVIAGQSNSAGYGRDSINDPPDPGLHVLRNSGQWDMASHPLNDSTGTIHEENREGSNPGHSPYLAFARRFREVSHIPVGLIQTSLGGSAMNPWNPREDGTLYRCMRKVIRSQGDNITGVLWYQGESDTHDNLPDSYLERFSQMVHALRTDLSLPGLPFFTVQLNRVTDTLLTSEEQLASDRGWGLVREAQRQAARTIPGVFVVPNQNSPLTDPIHNNGAGNLMLGERMARQASAVLYGGEPFQAPDLEEARMIDGDTILLSFAHLKGALLNYNSADSPFTVEDNLGIVPCQKWSFLAPDRLELTLERDLEGPGLVHGAWQRNPSCFLPTDSQTYLTMLSFYGVPIRAEGH